MESRRQDFEAFIINCGYHYADLRRIGTGYYNEDIDLMWKTWNAALDSLAVKS